MKSRKRYIWGALESRWHLCLRHLRVWLLFFILRYLYSSRLRSSHAWNVINTPIQSLWIFDTFSSCILTWAHSDLLLRGWQERFLKMCRAIYSDIRVPTYSAPGTRPDFSARLEGASFISLAQLFSGHELSPSHNVFKLKFKIKRLNYQQHSYL